MRKRKGGNKSSDESDGEGEGSDLIDEPEEFQDSGEDWTPNAGSRSGSRKRPSKPTVNNTQKKKRKASTTEESDAEDEAGEEEGDYEGEFGEEASEEEKNGSDGNKSDSSQSKDIPKYFHSGSFVLLKSDVKWSGDKVVSNLDELYLWKIDGKSLLQKYVPLTSNGKILHKCTCVYSGWSIENRDNYYPITEILDKNPKTDTKEPCVALNLDDLIKVRDRT